MEYRKAVSASITDTDTGGFRAYPAKFFNIDRQQHFIIPGTFTKAIMDFMDDGGMVLRDHENKTTSVIGTLLDGGEDNLGLVTNVQFSATKAGQETRKLILEKAVRKMSIDFIGTGTKMNESQIKKVWEQFGYIPNAEQSRRAKAGALAITKAHEIREISVVAVPANSEADIIAVKSFNGLDEFNDTPIEAVLPRIDLLAVMRRAGRADRILGRFQR